MARPSLPTELTVAAPPLPPAVARLAADRTSPAAHTDTRSVRFVGFPAHTDTRSVSFAMNARLEN